MQEAQNKKFLNLDVVTMHLLQKRVHKEIHVIPRSGIPENFILKENFYTAKSMMQSFGLGYQKIDTFLNFYNQMTRKYLFYYCDVNWCYYDVHTIVNLSICRIDR